MATLEEGLISYILSITALTTLIGERVFHLTKPATPQYPCLTVKRVETPREHSMEDSGVSGSLAHPTIQFEAWAATYAEAKAVTDELRDALDGKSGNIGSGGSAVTICVALVKDEASSYDTTSEKFSSRSDYVIWHEE